MPIRRETFVEQVAEDYDQIAKDGLSFPTARLYDDQIIAALPSRCGLIVDAGCGVGGLTSKLVEKADNVLAIDISQESIKTAETKISASNVRFLKASVEELPSHVKAGECSAIIANRVLHHCHDLPRVLNDLIGLLEPGGKLLVLDLDSTGNQRTSVGRFITRSLYRATLLMKAALHGSLYERYRDLEQEHRVYKSPAWQQHLTHEPDFSWRLVWGPLSGMSDVKIARRRVNWQFHLMTAERIIPGPQRESVLSSTPEVPTVKPRVFLSHAHKDKDLATKLVKLLRKGTGEKVTFCSSDGDIPTGSDFVARILDEIKGSTRVVFLVTPAFYESRFCLYEVGASWVQDRVLHPLLLGVPVEKRIPPFSVIAHTILSREALTELLALLLRDVGRSDSLAGDELVQWNHCAHELVVDALRHVEQADAFSRYARHTNAIVEQSIAECKKYIESFFSRKKEKYGCLTLISGLLFIKVYLLTYTRN